MSSSSCPAAARRTPGHHGRLALAAGVDALTYLPVLLVTLRLQPSAHLERPTQEKHWATDLVAGVALVAADPLLRIALALIALVAAVFVPVGAVLVPLLVRHRGWSPDTNGPFLGALPAGGLLVGLIISTTGDARAAAAAAGLLGTAGWVALVSADLSFPSSSRARRARGRHRRLHRPRRPVVLQHAPETHVSRVLSALAVIQAATLIASAPVLGRIFSALTPSAALLGCACVLAAATAAAAASPAWRTARQQRD